MDRVVERPVTKIVEVRLPEPAVVEECNRYDECGDFTAVYGDQVYVIEYRRSDFDAGCAAFPELSIVLRDLDLVVPEQSGYAYDGC